MVAPHIEFQKTPRIVEHYVFTILASTEVGNPATEIDPYTDMDGDTKKFNHQSTHSAKNAGKPKRCT